MTSTMTASVQEKIADTVIAANTVGGPRTQKLSTMAGKTQDFKTGGREIRQSLNKPRKNTCKCYQKIIWIL